MALTIDQADVLLVAPELSTLTGAQWASVLADVADEVGPGVAGSQARADRMAVQLAAHLATVRHKRTGASASPGALASVSVGGVSKTFAQPTAAASQAGALESTKYGQEYLRLVRLFGRRMEVL